MRNISFNSLIESIEQTHLSFQAQSVKAVNTGLTLRNWLIGFYIVEFEQNGDDRANYGTALIRNIANHLHIKGLTAPELSRCRQFYKAYPEILGSATQKLVANAIDPNILQVTSDRIVGAATQKLDKHENDLIASISYTHFVELIKINNPVKRRYYELFILKTQPTVKDLKREIATLSYERLGMSADKETAFANLAGKITPSLPQDIIKSHYLFEFLGINSPCAHSLRRLKRNRTRKNSPLQKTNKRYCTPSVFARLHSTF